MARPRLWLTSGLGLIMLLVGGVCAIMVVPECPNEMVRLSKRVQPEHYMLDIRVDPYDGGFNGTVEIDVKHVADPGCSGLLSWARTSLPCDRTKVILHACNSMEFDQIAYEEVDSGLDIPLKGVCRSLKNDQLIIELSREPSPNSSGKLRIDYRARMRTNPDGLARFYYRDPDTNELINMMATQLEPAYQRNVFPGFDEPEFKATFELAVEHPSDTQAIFNMPVVREELVRSEETSAEEKEFTKTYFGRTPKMSSYLFAFAVGQFDHIQKVVDDNMTLGIYTAPGRSDEARESLEIAVKAYKALGEFFEIEQPVHKIDFVGVRGFPAAMENWGLIMMNDLAIFANRYEHDAEEMDEKMSFVIHELVHNWFGNLVTMRWWDNLWLNEGFTNWMQVEMTEQLYPNSGAEAIWMLTKRRDAQQDDADEKLCHPIKNPLLQTVDQFKASFDMITYQKSHSIIKMLDHYIGRDKFKEGLRVYIRKYLYGNTEDSDLWQVLADSSGLDVKEMMRTWLTQEGFPLVSAKMSANGNLLEVSQQRFASTAGDGYLRKQTWVVPISLLVSDGKDKLQEIKFVLSKAKDTIKLPVWFNVDQPGHWLKLNSEYEGFWYASYEPKLMQALRHPIETKKMGPIDRLNVIDEYLAMYNKNMIKRPQLIELLGWFKNEDDHAVIAIISIALERLMINKFDSENPGIFTCLVNYYNKYGFADDVSEWPSLIQRYARGLSLARLVKSGYEPAITDSLQYYARENGKVLGFLREGVYFAIGRRGTMAQWTEVIQWLSKIDSERQREMWKYYLLQSAGHDLERLRAVKLVKFI